MNNTGNSLIEGLERLGLIASRIRKNQNAIPQIEIDIILQELRSLYMVALQLEAESPEAGTARADAASCREMLVGQKVSEEKRLAEETAAKKAAEEKRLAEEAVAKKAAEEKRLAEEAAAKRAAEEKRLAEEAAAKKAAEEKRLAEAAAAKRAAEEKRLAEAAAAKKAAEEKRLAEEAAARRAAEEKRLAEEAAAKKAAEEKRLAEEAAARRAAEEKRLAEEAAAAAMTKPLFAPETPKKAPEPIMPPTLDRLEGHPNDELFSDTPMQPTQTKEGSLFDYLKPEKQEKPTVRTLADTLSQNSRSVEDVLESRVNAHKVDDLRPIININDKFSIMSELFHNNMKAYNDFILRLNAIDSREEALAYVNEVAEQNHWAENSVVVATFYKIFDRKF